VLGGLKGVSRLVGRVKREGELKVNISPVRQAAGRGPEIGNGFGNVLQGQMSLAAKQADSAIRGLEVHSLIKSRKSLVWLVPRKLNRTDAVTDLRMKRIELERPEVGGQGFVGLAHCLQRLGEREVGLGFVRFDLDGRLVPLDSRGQTSSCSLDIAKSY
jgi:hypothetical protein